MVPGGDFFLYQSNLFIATEGVSLAMIVFVPSLHWIAVRVRRYSTRAVTGSGQLLLFFIK
jgi:hypothetical protein